MNNPYEVLGVQKNATQQQIKKAYREKSKLHHPDLGGNQQQFKKVNQANQILSDQKKRRNYDSGLNQQSNGQSPFEDIWDVFSRFGNRTQNHNVKVQASQSLTLQQVMTGCAKQIIVNLDVQCTSCNGTCCINGKSKVKCNLCNGSGKRMHSVKNGNHLFQQIVTCHQCHGFGQLINESDKCKTCNGNGSVKVSRTISMDIPSGMPNNSTWFVPGILKQQNTKNRNDLYLHINHIKHDVFNVIDNDIFIEYYISFYQSITGRIIKIKNLQNNYIQINIPANIKSGTQIVKPNNGLLIRNNNHNLYKGNLVIKITISAPKELTNEQILVIKELGEYAKDLNKKIINYTGN